MAEEVTRVRSGKLPHDLSDIDPLPSASAAEFAALMARISGGITLDEAIFLRDHAAQVRDGCIVEVGSFRGKSAVAIALGAQIAGSGALLYCIEPHMPFKGFYTGQFGPQDRKEFYRAMLASGAYWNCSLVNLSSEDVTGAWQRPVAMIFIDGDHTYEGVKRDFDCWHRHVMPGGLVIFDDACDAKAGPARLLAEILPSDGWTRIDAPGKFVAMRRCGLTAVRPAIPRPLELLVPCNRLVMAGGLLRFDRLARAIAPLGHRLSFLPFNPSDPAFRPFAGIVTQEEAERRQWDAVMVPGAGFARETIERFRAFRDPRYGVRVQHVLNDQTRRTAFAAVNAALDPDLVIFNNDAWPVGSYTGWRGQQFHIMHGAVDSDHFAPSDYQQRHADNGHVMIGGQARKNAAPLIEALQLLPSSVRLTLFGPPPPELADTYGGMIDAGRLTLAGSLDESALRAFYHGVDMIVATEEFAGWSNMAAEAAACGVPLICTRHGTQPFAHDGQTALLLEEAKPAAIATAIRTMIDNPEAARSRADRAREAVARFDWHRYGEQMVDLLSRPLQSHYFRSEEIGLLGKWGVADRLNGVDLLFEQCDGLDILDLGAAEGLVSLRCLKGGARSVTGFELDAGRVRLAQELADQQGFADRARFYAASLEKWDQFLAAQQGHLAPAYDIVLYLGIHQHLRSLADRDAALTGALALARTWFAIRTPTRFWQEEAIHDRIVEAGWTQQTLSTQGDADHGPGGTLRIYARDAQR